MDALRKSVAKRGGETRTHQSAGSPASRRKSSPRKHPAARKTTAKKRKAS
jgi:hypothetical protein